MLTARQILEATKRSHPIVIQNAKKVRVQFRKVEAGKDSNGEFREVIAICKGSSIPRQVTVRFYGPKDLSVKTWISCTCEYFLYVCEVALDKKGSSDIIYSNGDDPQVTNPRKTPRTCKHCVAVILNGAFELEPKAKPSRKKAPATKKTPTRR